MRVLGCALVLLGFCVFAWGLRYKLSLYDSPHSVTHRMPEAKLLTGKERPALPAADMRQAGVSLALAGVALGFCVLLGIRLFAGFSGWASRPAPVVWVSQRPAGLAAFTRPPPIVR